MLYPKYIYRDFEIVEKEICGETHYAVMETKKFWFWTRRFYLYIGGLGNNGYESYKGYGNIWNNRKSICDSAIETMNWESEYRFKRKVLN